MILRTSVQFWADFGTTALSKVEDQSHYRAFPPHSHPSEGYSIDLPMEPYTYHSQPMALFWNKHSITKSIDRTKRASASKLQYGYMEHQEKQS
eukprot:3000398-Amphidinium_carterae.1